LISLARDSTRLESWQNSIGGLLIPASASSMTPTRGGLDLFGIGRDSSAFASSQKPVRLLDDEDLELDLGFDDHLEEHRRSTRHGSGAHLPGDRFSAPPIIFDDDAVPVHDEVSFLWDMLSCETDRIHRASSQTPMILSPPCKAES
jgi:hypothetical protein